MSAALIRPSAFVPRNLRVAFIPGDRDLESRREDLWLSECRLEEGLLLLLLSLPLSLPPSPFLLLLLLLPRDDPMFVCLRKDGWLRDARGGLSRKMQQSLPLLF